MKGELNMVKHVGEIRFVLDDERATPFNESVDLTYQLYADELDELLPIEDFRSYCKQFALAIGYHPNTVDEVFGKEI